jgi:hypothetical protein
MNDLEAVALECAFGVAEQVVAHPNLKQVTQDEQSVRLDALHEVTPSLEGRVFAALQVHIRDESDVRPSTPVHLAGMNGL